MSCREWEEAIALLVDGEPAVTGLAEHIDDCAVCRQLFQELRADQAALRATPAVDLAACETLRSAVLRRVGRRSQWYAAAATIAAGLTIVSILVRMHGRPVEPVAQKREPTMEASVPKRTVTRKPRKERPSIPAAVVELALDSEWGRILSASTQIDEKPARRGSTSEIAMNIQTSDPDVVILWLKEEVKGDSNE